MLLLLLSKLSVSFRSWYFGFLVLFFLLTWCEGGEGWHAYDRHKHDQLKRDRTNCDAGYSIDTLLNDINGLGNDTCPCYHEATRPYSHEFVEKLAMWPNLMSEYDAENGESLFGSQLALELIWRNQNPPDCKKAKYLVSGGWPYGFGSRIHMEGMVLALAVHLGRVYLPHPDGDNLFWETKIPFCQSQNDETLTCFYQKLSKCTIADAIANSPYSNVNDFKGTFMDDYRDVFESTERRRQMVKSLADHKGVNVVLTTGRGPYDGHKFLPHQVFPLLHCSPMKAEFYYYWWRAVSAAYIVRPNDATKGLLASLHTNQPFHHHDGEQCIAMFVRHGDKGIDMKLLEFEEYRAVATELWDHGMVPGSYNYLKKNQLLSGQSVGGGGSTHNNNSNTETAEGGGGESSHHHHHQPRRNHRRHLSTARATGKEVPQSKRRRRLNLHDTIVVHDPADSTTKAESPPSEPLSHDNQADIASTSGESSYIPPTKEAPDALDTPGGSHYYDFHYSLPMNGTLFITTEDPKVLQDAEEFGQTNHWKIIFTDLFDRASQTAYKTWEEQHRRGTKAVHHELEYISMLFNLQLSTQCEAWICTLASNSCRIMDEFRATIGGKANRFYADISKETCDDVPCVAEHGTIKSFGE